MFQKLVAVQEISPDCLALAEKFFGLVIPMAALLVVARAQWHHGVRLRRIGHDYDLSRSLPAASYHLLTARAETDRPDGSHAGILNGAAADWPGVITTLAADAKVLAIRDAQRAEG